MSELTALGVPNHGIEVDAQSVWCTAHKNVIFVDPARRFDLASVRLFDFAVRDERVKIACGYNPMTGGRADPAKLTEVLKAFSPLCCFIPGEQLNRVYREAYYGLFEKAQAAMINAERVAGRVVDSRGTEKGAH
jgi:hypothetical protein